MHLTPHIQVGQHIAYPADRGMPAGAGAIRFISPAVSTNIHGVQFVWVTIQGGGVWPSHRLGVKVTP